MYVKKEGNVLRLLSTFNVTGKKSSKLVTFYEQKNTTLTQNRWKQLWARRRYLITSGAAALPHRLIGQRTCARVFTCVRGTVPVHNKCSLLLLLRRPAPTPVSSSLTPSTPSPPSILLSVLDTSFQLFPRAVRVRRHILRSTLIVYPLHVKKTDLLKFKKLKQNTISLSMHV